MSPISPKRQGNTGNVASRDPGIRLIRSLNSREPASHPRASGLQHHEVFLGCMPNSLKRNPAIECYESSAMPNGEAEQVHIRNLPRTVDPRCIENSRIKETRCIRPELVDPLSARLRQPPDERLNGLRVGIRRARHDANAAILGQRTRRPTFLCLPRKPRNRRLVRNVIRIKHGNQHVDVK